MRYGAVQSSVNAENAKTMSTPRSPCFESFRTYVYAVPAQNPEPRPTRAGRLAMPAVGLMTNSAPMNAMSTETRSTRFGRSFRMKYDMMMAKKGLILFKMLESARASRSMAQKLATMPSVPNAQRRNSGPQESLRTWNFSSLRASPTNAMTNATMLRKKTFWMEGTSPESLTKNVMRLKKNAARTMYRMPLAFGGTLAMS